MLAMLCAGTAGAQDRLGDPLPQGAVQRLGTLRMRYDRVGDLAYLPDGRALIATGAELEIWNLKAGRQVFRDRVLENRIVCVDVRTDGTVLLLTDSEGNVHEWSLEKKTVLRSFPTGLSDLNSAYYSPDESRVLAAGGDPPTLKEFEPGTGKELAHIEGRMHSFRQGIYGPDGKTAFADGRAGSDPILAHYDLTAGKLLNEWHKDYYSHWRSLELSADGERLLAGTRHMAIEFRIDGYEELHRYRGHHGHAATSVAYCKDPDQILTGSRDGSIRLWNRVKEEVLRRWVPHESTCAILRVSPDGERVLSYGGGTVVESELATGNPTVEWDRHSQGVEAVAALGDGKRAVSASADGTLRIWEIAGGKSLGRIEGARLGAYAAAVSPDGKRIAVGCKDGLARVFELPSGKLLRELGGHLGYVRSVAYTPDGSRLLSSADDGTVRVWRAGSDSAVAVLKGHLGGVPAVAVGPKGKRALSGGRDGTVRLWDLEKMRPVGTFEGHRGRVEAVCFGETGDRAFSSGRDGRILKWNLKTGQVEAEMIHGEEVQSLACSPDGRVLFSGGEDGMIRSWNLKTGKQIGTFIGHKDDVMDLAVTPDGRYLISGSTDTSLLVWAMPKAEKR